MALRFAIAPYRQWLQRISAYDGGLEGVLDWVERVNKRLFEGIAWIVR